MHLDCGEISLRRVTIHLNHAALRLASVLHLDNLAHGLPTHSASRRGGHGEPESPQGQLQIAGVRMTAGSELAIHIWTHGRTSAADEI